MTFKQAIETKEQKDQQQLQQQKQEEMDNKKANKLFDKLDIQKQVCDRIDCADCIACRTWEYMLPYIRKCKVKQGTARERLKALAQMDHWMKGIEFSDKIDL